MTSWRSSRRPDCHEGPGPLHGLVAAGAAGNAQRRFSLFYRDARSSKIQRQPGVEADSFAVLFRGGMAKPVVTDSVHPSRSHMAQVAFDELLSRNALQPKGHRGGGPMHALTDAFGRLAALPHVGKEQQGVAMKSPILAKILNHRRGDRDHAVPPAFAGANPELVLPAAHIVNGQRETFGNAQSAAIDELERNAVAAQADVDQQIADLLASEHDGQLIVILGSNLGEDNPVRVAFKIDEEHSGRSDALANGLGLPELYRFDVEQIIAHLAFAEGGGIAPEVFVDEAHGPVIGVAGGDRVVAQGQQLGELGHRGPGMIVKQRVGAMRASLGADLANGRGWGGGG
jgi:hypothetical protein